jgi:hypothetical protein
MSAFTGSQSQMDALFILFGPNWAEESGRMQMANLERQYTLCGPDRDPSDPDRLDLKAIRQKVRLARVCVNLRWANGELIQTDSIFRGDKLVGFVKAEMQSIQSTRGTSILPQGKDWDEVEMSFIAVADGQNKVLALHEMLGTYGDEVMVVVRAADVMVV